MHSKSDNIEIMINDEADKVLEELFQPLISRYQIGLETSIKGSDFVSECVRLYLKCHKINFKRGGSNINSAYWIKSEKAKISPINKNDNKCFQYAVTVALNQEKIGKNE